MIRPVGSADAGEKMCMSLNNILYLWKIYEKGLLKMGHLITLAAASLIAMSGISASAVGISRNIETAIQK